MHQTLHYIILWSALIVLFPTISASQGSVTLLDPLDSLAGRYKHIPEEYSAFRGLIIEEVDVTHYYPIIPYIYFDSGSGTIPSRYILFTDSAQTLSFDETRLSGSALDIHHHFLNILGSRLRRNPWLRVSIAGCNSQDPESGENINTSAERGNIVYDYLANIWGIAAEQVKLLPARGLSESPSNRRDPRGIVENRRVDVRCVEGDCWEFVRPVVQNTIRLDYSRSIVGIHASYDKTMSKQYVEVRRNGEVWNRIAIYEGSDSLIFYNWKNTQNDDPVRNDSEFHFQYVSYDSRGNEYRSNEIVIPVMYVSMVRAQKEFLTDRRLIIVSLVQGLFGETDHLGNYNHRILKSIVCPSIPPISRIEVTSYRDCIGLSDRNLRISENHLWESIGGLDQYCKRQRSTIQSRAVGSMYPIYDNRLPEGRQCNRGVQIVIDIPGIISNER